TSAASSQLSISNTLASHNAASGVFIGPFGSGTATAVLDHVGMNNNGSHGLFVFGGSSTGTINVTSSNSSSTNNTNSGIFVSSDSAATAVMVRNSAMANNVNNGLSVFGARATIRVTHSTITGSATGFETTGSGVLESFGDNALSGNSTDGAPT